MHQISTHTVLGRFFANTGSSCSLITPPTATPIFSQEFPTIEFNPPASTINGNTASVDDTTRPLTNITTDLNANFTTAIVSQGNGNHGNDLSLARFVDSLRAWRK